MDLFNEVATNTKSEEDGVWEAYGDKIEFLIARSNNGKYNKLISKHYEKNKTLLERKNSEIAEEKSDDIMVDVLARTVLLGWRAQTGHTLDEVKFQKQPIGPYTVDRAKQILGMKEMHDFRAWIQEKAKDADRYRAVAEEEIAGE